MHSFKLPRKAEDPRVLTSPNLRGNLGLKSCDEGEMAHQEERESDPGSVFVLCV